MLAVTAKLRMASADCFPVLAHLTLSLALTLVQKIQQMYKMSVSFEMEVFHIHAVFSDPVLTLPPCLSLMYCKMVY